MNDVQNYKLNQDQSLKNGLAPFWVVFTREFSELWIWGKALILIFLFSILLGIMSFVLSANSELDLIPPKEMLFLILQVAMAVGLFLSLIIGADSVSGERERGTLEALLLTPISRRQIIFGKFLAAISPWPVAFIITVPYLVVLSQGDESLGQTIIWGAVLGTLLAPAFTGFGMLVSIKSNSNKTSFFISLLVYVLFLLPTQFPGAAQTGEMGKLLKRINPLESVNHFLEKILVNNRTFAEVGDYLAAPIVFAVIVFGVLFLYASPRLRLEVAGTFTKLRAQFSKIVGLVFIVIIISSLSTISVMAQQEEEGEEPDSVDTEIMSSDVNSQEENTTISDQSSEEETDSSTDQSSEEKINTSSDQSVEISVNMNAKTVNTGDKINFNTTVKYSGTTEESSPMIVAMNIINLEGEGDPVDPEDWSPERTQYLEPLAPGESVSLSWIITPILEGDYIVYMVLVPEPAGAEQTSHPISSSGIHLTVNAFTKINPGGILPIVIIEPIVLIVGLIFVLWFRKRRIRVESYT
ncbi:MAG: ABC transporter permease subunit [Ignavibacteriaceae bacterium]